MQYIGTLHTVVRARMQRRQQLLSLQGLPPQMGWKLSLLVGDPWQVDGYLTIMEAENGLFANYSQSTTRNNDKVAA